jgi:hypothetical protein
MAMTLLPMARDPLPLATGMAALAVPGPLGHAGTANGGSGMGEGNGQTLRALKLEGVPGCLQHRKGCESQDFIALK